MGRNSPSDTFRHVALIIMAFGVAMGAAFYYVFDPVGTRWMPQCIFHRLTGYDCPGCGSQRMIHALLHGDLSAAWNANAFLLIIMPLLMVMAFLELKRKQYPRLYSLMNSMPMVIAISVAVAGWFIVRNFISM